MRPGIAKWLALLALAGAAPVHAQAYQCSVPARVSVPQVRPDGPARQVPITGYTLALSWSPEFCKGRESRADDAVQCSRRNGRFGRHDITHRRVRISHRQRRKR